MNQLDVMWFVGFTLGIYLIFIKESVCTLWKRDLDLEQKTMTGIVIFTSIMDFPGCSMACFGNQACNIFTFDKATNTCLGFTRFGTSDDNNTQVIKPETYVKAVINTKIMLHNEEKNYSDASATCIKYGGRLLSLDTKEKEKYMIKNFAGPGFYWVGLNDQTTEGSWTWENGKPFVRDLSIFKTDLNNYDSGMTGSLKYNADCAILNIKNEFYYDIHCSGLVKYFCEKKISKTLINY